MEFILLVNVKMPRNNINKHDKYNICEFESKTSLYFSELSFYEELKFHAQLSCAWKQFYNPLDSVKIVI